MAKSEKCEVCHGTGKVTVTVVGAEQFSGCCFYCRRGRVPAGANAARREADAAFWCRCGASTTGAFHDDDQCHMCAKHHWHCGSCGKIVQVG